MPPSKNVPAFFVVVWCTLPVLLGHGPLPSPPPPGLVVVVVVVVLVVRVVVDVLVDDEVDVLVLVDVDVGEPVHVTPLSLNDVGDGLEPDHEPLNPGVADAPVPREPFQLMFRTVTVLPDWLNSPDQPWSTRWPAENVHSSVQLETASPRLVTVTLAPKPPFHWLDTT
jgi:hypothetical protein